MGGTSVSYNSKQSAAKSCNPDLLISERDSNHTKSNQIQAQLSREDIASVGSSNPN